MTTRWPTTWISSVNTALVGLLLLLASGLSYGIGHDPETTDRPNTSATQAVTDLDIPVLRWLVDGIIEHSQWPAPNHGITLCLAGNPELLASVQAQPRHSRHGLLAVRTIDAQANASALQDCSVLYIGQRIPQDTALRWVLALQSKAIVSIRENPVNCKDGAMICLYVTHATIPRLDINLGSVSLSGVRISPQILTLTNSLPSGLLPTLDSPSRRDP